MTRHLEKQSKDGPTAPASVPQAPYNPRKLGQSLSERTVVAILAAYGAGASSREVAAQFHLAHSSVQKLLHQHGVTLRRRGPRARS